MTILATKLFIPPPPSKVVLRPRLLERLREGLNCKLTLISAPAGFGKTTLVSEWISDCRRQCGQKLRLAWLSLDEGDSEPARFLTYLVAALRISAPEIGEEVLVALQSPQPPPIDSILISLLNEISALQGDSSTGSGDSFILVLDDYHLIDARAIDEALTFLVDHQPPQLHLVITTREDPSLPLSRLRARGQVVELRAMDMRFTAAEAAEFLNQVMDLALSPEEVASLEARTEGWIAGLQLAALSMKSSQDVSGFIRAFAGDHRYIVDYLVEEVLQRQPESVRSFLLQTSLFDRLNGPLCDAVTGQPGGKARLETLQRGNFFIIPLDDRRHWYRYHHLFADVLRMHLMAEQADLVAGLHQRASEWYEQNGMPADAICHALAAQDFERSADLIERAVPFMRQSRQEALLLDWLQALPNQVFHQRPVLSVHYAGTLLQNGHLDGVESRLRDAEHWLNLPADLRDQPVFMDADEFRRLPASIAMYHAGIALVRGEVSNSIMYAQRVREIAQEEDVLLHGAASALLGLAFWTCGELEAAHSVYAEGMAYLQKAGFISDVIGGSVTLADIRNTQGRLREAMSIYERGLHMAVEQGKPVLRGAADMHVGLSEFYYERNDLDTALQHLQKSKELGELNGLPKNPYRWRIAMAKILEAQGDLNSALHLLDEAERLYVGDFSPNVRPVSARKVRVWLAQGRLSGALNWVGERNLSAGDDLSFLGEYEHITMARILLAQFKSNRARASIHQAVGLLERLMKAAEEGGRVQSVIEILVLAALAHQMQDNDVEAIASLERALRLAEPEVYVRMFVDEGANMEKLLRKVAAQGTMPAYVRKLLSAFQAGQQVPAGETPRSASPVTSILVEPLSQREKDILRLFKTELSGPEIASELMVALSTIRTHTKSIYSKLNVNSRRAAVNRAIELGLI